MSELENIVNSFKTSEPVFSISLDSNEKELNFEVKNQYKPEKNGEPVHDLLVDTWRENLNIQKRKFDTYMSFESVYSRILGPINTVIVNSSPLKNPKQSRLYKWFNEQRPRHNDPLSVGYIALYRYIVTNDLEENRDNTNPHAKNVLAILELIREQHEIK